MRKLIPTNDRGFTLVELIMVIVIMGILAAVAVPKFINMSDSALKAKCEANRMAIQQAAAMKFSNLLITDPVNNGNWLRDATMGSMAAGDFDSGAIPTCPTTGEYTLSFGVVGCSEHT